MAEIQYKQEYLIILCFKWLYHQVEYAISTPHSEINLAVSGAEGRSMLV